MQGEDLQQLISAAEKSVKEKSLGESRAVVRDVVGKPLQVGKDQSNYNSDMDMVYTGSFSKEDQIRLIKSIFLSPAFLIIIAIAVISFIGISSFQKNNQTPATPERFQNFTAPSANAEQNTSGGGKTMVRAGKSVYDEDNKIVIHDGTPSAQRPDEWQNEGPKKFSLTEESSEISEASETEYLQDILSKPDIGTDHNTMHEVEREAEKMKMAEPDTIEIPIPTDSESNVS